MALSGVKICLEGTAKRLVLPAAIAVLLLLVLISLRLAPSRATLSHDELQVRRIHQHAPPVVGTQLEERDIYEAIFRYRIQQSGSKEIFFLSINGGDPNDEFMARFSKSSATIKKGSEAHFAKQPSPGWLIDRATGVRGVSLSVAYVAWVSSDLAEVKGSSYCGGRCADAGTYRVAKQNSRWFVLQYDIRFVS